MLDGVNNGKHSRCKHSAAPRVSEDQELQAPSRQKTSALAPLRGPAFRMLWLSWFAANLTVAMNDVAAQWLMTTLSDDALMVALVQSAATLPVFVLGLPSGALADILDRRRYLAGTLLWGALVATALWALVAAHMLTAELLLVLTFATGIGVAMRWPVFIALIPEFVSTAELPAAIGLNAVGVHLSRLLGPILAGVFLASFGAEYVFMMNAVLSITAFALVMMCRPTPKQSKLPSERFISAMRVGVKHVVESPAMRVVLTRTFVFFFQVTALTALLPLVARTYQGGGLGSFTVMLAAMGGGAAVCIFMLPQLRSRLGSDGLVYAGTVIYGLASVIVVLSPNLWLALPTMALAGAAWIAVANSLTIAAQLTLPSWVRARGMSFVQIAMMGGIASGAALWGYVARVASVEASIFAAAVIGPVLLFLMHRRGVAGAGEEDLTPVVIGSNLVPPALELGSEDGPVIVTIEYLIDPARADDFRLVMKETRSARLRQGALSWRLYFDITEPGRYIEQIVNESWVDHQRLLERFTASDTNLKARRLAFHLGDSPPRIHRYLER